MKKRELTIWRGSIKDRTYNGFFTWSPISNGRMIQFDVFVDGDAKVIKTQWMYPIEYINFEINKIK